MKKHRAPGAVPVVAAAAWIARALAVVLVLSPAACERKASSGELTASGPAENVRAAVAAASPIAAGAVVQRPLPAAAPAADRGLCPALCARAAVLRCPGGAQCASRCQEMRALPGCGREMDAALRCFMALPTSGWECAADGLPSVKEGQCEREQAAVAACLGR
jgi:hypothetical protein